MQHAARADAGLTLVELVVGIAILVIVAVGLASNFGILSKTTADESRADDATQEREALRSQLKQAFEGMRGTLGTALRIVAPIALGCRDSSFCVVPGLAFDDSPASGFDQLYVVIKQPMASAVVLGDAYPEEPLSIGAADGATKLDAIFKKGDFLVLARPGSSDVVQLLGEPPAAAFGTIGTGSLGFDHTARFGVEQSTVGRNYALGDDVIRASIVKFGVDRTTGKLRRLDLASGRVTDVARGVESFTFQYTVRAETDGTCDRPELVPTVKSADWSVVNTDQDCYARIDTLSLKFDIRGVAGALSYQSNN